VVEEMKQRLISQHCIFEDKIIVVPNSEKKEFAKNFDTFKNDYFSDYPDKFVISYVGGFGPHRGLHNAIEGMKWVSNVIPNSLLVLVGPSNKDVRTHLENIVEKNNLQKHVLIKGSEPFSRVIDIMKGSDINIIPHISNEHTESAVPHKFFQILLSKKPLLVSDCAPMKRIIDVNGVGTYFKADNPEDFAKKVIDIERDYDKSIKIAEKGFNEAFNGSLNWESTSKDLIKLYNEL
jgi:glycosyltransferase involved in cell wall biosynthesis